MRKCSLVLLCLSGALAAGCHDSPYIHTHLELLNAEKRAIEDELYELGFDYEDACREIEKLRQQNARLRGTPDVPSRDSTDDSRRSSSPSPPSRGSKSNLEPPMIDEVTEPKIELPPGPDNREMPYPKSNSTPGTSPPLPPTVPPRSPTKSSEHKAPAGGEVPTRTLSLEPADPRVTHIVLNQVLTGGTGFDKNPGDDGIAVVIEPRNRDDAFVALAGPVTVLVLDPAKSAEQGRIVARWEIDANEAQKALRNSPKIRGIELRLPWPGKPPETSRLHLHVRYMTIDNRDLRTDRQLFLNVPGQFTQQWTPRAATRFSANSQPDPISLQPSDAGPRAVAEGGAQHRTQPSEDAFSSTELSTPSASPAGSTTSVPTQATRPEWRPNR